MYFQQLNETQKKHYKERLKLLASLSRLFSDSKVPYLYYRVAERIYCDTLNAEDLSRGDISVDAVLSSGRLRYGVGLKTFLHNNGKTFQKIAEFNKSLDEYATLESSELALKIASLRNKRILFANNSCRLDSNFYHCVLREENKLHIFEESMLLIDTEKIKIINDRRNILNFNDGTHEYTFNRSKSTLLKRFVCSDDNIIDTIEAPILKDPFKLLESFPQIQTDIGPVYEEYVILPLYSIRGGRNVPEKSGLNNWNASGRARHEDEIYIRIPSHIHEKYPNFFPERDTNFELQLPNGRVIISKVCQSGNKALMSNPNKELGHWLLRDVLNIKPGELVTLKNLEEVGIDSVKVMKKQNGSFSIYFSQVGSYEDFCL